MEFNVFYSAKGNNQFVKLPYNVPKTDLCTFLDGPFTRYGVAKHLSDASDFPAPQKGKSLCVLYAKVMEESSSKGNFNIFSLQFSRQHTL